MLKTIDRYMAKVIDVIGYILAGLLLLMVLNVAWDVMMRYVFRASSVGMQEMEWHLFAVIILYGVGVALRHEAHVRVDFLYDRYSDRKKAVINLLGTFLFLLPLALLLFFGSIEFAQDAFSSGEISEDPGGLPYRWVIKSMIPLSFAFLVFSAIEYILQNIALFRRSK